MHELVVTSPDEISTLQIADKLARQLKGGELIELVGDLGSGKTTFVKGLAKGLGSKDPVSSPSFVLKNTYDGRLRLNHFDLYRLSDPGLIKHEIKDALDEKDSVTAVEWAGATGEVLPEKRIIIELIPQKDDKRRIKISYRGAQ
ncbi:MAG TPA: tRNA (adenosine(37)-N6)-threonylcarbamoyltransferase complex ATPase subunit type 1 TsaE [Candidatus Saccharimonadales bacterium]|nr:tRNA (adenosine(37)-N6)-threonylcarbamoyltransferase complex ATPase subunit type 1 TsaE [Candidatus Saccharimonadales bacterium]